LVAIFLSECASPSPFFFSARHDFFPQFLSPFFHRSSLRFSSRGFFCCQPGPLLLSYDTPFSPSFLYLLSSQIRFFFSFRRIRWSSPTLSADDFVDSSRCSFSPPPPSRQFEDSTSFSCWELLRTFSLVFCPPSPSAFSSLFCTAPLPLSRPDLPLPAQLFLLSQ